MRGRRGPVTALQLAQSLDVSERTIYRDLAELAAQGAPIEGEAGVGYILRPGLFLPPLMLSEDETEAVNHAYEVGRPAYKVFFAGESGAHIWAAAQHEWNQ